MALSLADLLALLQSKQQASTSVTPGPLEQGLPSDVTVEDTTTPIDQREKQLLFPNGIPTTSHQGGLARLAAQSPTMSSTGPTSTPPPTTPQVNPLPSAPAPQATPKNASAWFTSNPEAEAKTEKDWRQNKAAGSVAKSSAEIVKTLASLGYGAAAGGMTAGVGDAAGGASGAAMANDAAGAADAGFGANVSMGWGGQGGTGLGGYLGRLGRNYVSQYGGGQGGSGGGGIMSMFGGGKGGDATGAGGGMSSVPGMGGGSGGGGGMGGMMDMSGMMSKAQAGAEGSKQLLAFMDRANLEKRKQAAIAAGIGADPLTIVPGSGGFWS